jgi:hypothetical protein
MERATCAADGDSRTAMDGPDPKQSCPLEWVSQGTTERLQGYFKLSQTVTAMVAVQYLP